MTCLLACCCEEAAATQLGNSLSGSLTTDLQDIHSQMLMGALLRGHPLSLSTPDSAPPKCADSGLPTTALQCRCGGLSLVPCWLRPATRSFRSMLFWLSVHPHPHGCHPHPVSHSGTSPALLQPACGQLGGGLHPWFSLTLAILASISTTSTGRPVRDSTEAHQEDLIFHR